MVLEVRSPESLVGLVWFLLEPLGESRVDILEAVYSSLLVPLLFSKSADEHLQTSLCVSELCFHHSISFANPSPPASLL